MKLVKKVSQNWKKMDGSSLLEKKLNAYLCSFYISDSEAPSDECLSYAKKFSKLKHLDKNDTDFVKSTLKEYFWTASDLKGNIYHLKDPNNSLSKSTKKVIEIIKEFREKT